jgi:hypothetical protein
MWAYLVATQRKETFELSGMPFAAMGNRKKNKEVI